MLSGQWNPKENDKIFLQVLALRGESLNQTKETSSVTLIDTGNLNGTTYQSYSLQAEAWLQKTIAPR